MYKTVLFDADGTLLDFGRSEKEAVKEAFAMSGIDADDEMTEEYSRINDRLWKLLEYKQITRDVLMYRRFEIFCEKYGFCADARKIASDYVGLLAQKGYLIDGAGEMLEALFGKVRMYIVTNGTASVQRGRHKRVGIEKFFGNIFISEEIGYNKPDVRFFQYVSAHIPNFQPSETLVVGDSLSSDIQGGNAFGLDTCLYDPFGKQDRTDIIPTYRVKDFNEITDIIEGGVSNGRK